MTCDRDPVALRYWSAGAMAGAALLILFGNGARPELGGIALGCAAWVLWDGLRLAAERRAREDGGEP